MRMSIAQATSAADNASDACVDVNAPDVSVPSGDDGTSRARAIALARYRAAATTRTVAITPSSPRSASSSAAPNAPTAFSAKSGTRRAVVTDRGERRPMTSAISKASQ